MIGLVEYDDDDDDGDDIENIASTSTFQGVIHCDVKTNHQDDTNITGKKRIIRPLVEDPTESNYKKTKKGKLGKRLKFAVAGFLEEVFYFDHTKPVDPNAPLPMFDNEDNINDKNVLGAINKPSTPTKSEDQNNNNSNYNSNSNSNGNSNGNSSTDGNNSNLYKPFENGTAIKKKSLFSMPTTGRQFGKTGNSGNESSSPNNNMSIGEGKWSSLRSVNNISKSVTSNIINNTNESMTTTTTINNNTSSMGEGKWSMLGSKNNKTKLVSLSTTKVAKLVDMEYFCDNCTYTIAKNEIRYECEDCPDIYCFCEFCYDEIGQEHPHKLKPNKTLVHIKM